MAAIIWVILIWEKKIKRIGEGKFLLAREISFSKEIKNKIAYYNAVSQISLFQLTQHAVSI